MQGFVITTTGEDMLARASAGEALKLTGVAVGQGVTESAAQAKALTSLLDHVAAATSTKPAVSAGQVSMIVEYRNDLNGGLKTGFTLSEFGLFAQIGDDQPALMYYAALGDNPHPVIAIADGLDIHRFPVAIAVTGDVAVTLGYPAGAFVSTEEMAEALNNLDFSAYIPVKDKGVANGVATLGADSKLVAAQRPNAAELKMSDGTTTIEQMLANAFIVKPEA